MLAQTASRNGVQSTLLQRGKRRTALKVLTSFVRQGTVIPQFRMQEAKRYLPRSLRPKEIDIRGPLLKQEIPVDVGLGGKGVEERQSADLYRLSEPAIVHTEDRMSMVFSREIRLPFLDHRLVDLLLPPPSGVEVAGWMDEVGVPKGDGNLLANGNRVAEG